MAIVNRQMSSSKYFIMCVSYLLLSLQSFAQWTTSGSNIYSSNSGNVGIGTLSPTTKFNLSLTGTTTTKTSLSAFGSAGLLFIDGLAGATGSEIGLFGGNGYNSLSSGIGMARENASDWGTQLRFYTHITSTAGEPGDISEKMRITGDGSVGIGATNPNATLAVGSSRTLSGSTVISLYNEAKVASAVSSNMSALRLRNVGLAGSYTIANAYGIKIDDIVLQPGVTSSKSYGIYIGKTTDPITGGVATANYALVTEPAAGNVGIGTTSPSEKLTVNGNVAAKKIIITQSGWSDYVFDKKYKLRTLASLETFINQNNHLPEVPSAKEVEVNGISVGDTLALLLKKIEELTLYAIAQQKQLDTQIKKIKQLEIKVSKAKSGRTN